MYNFLEKFNSCSKMDSGKTDYRGGLQCIINNRDIDMCFTRITNHLVPNNEVIQKNADGKYFIEIKLSKDSDFVTNFNFECENRENVKIEMVFNREFNREINSDLTLVYLCAAFMHFYIRFTFNEMPFEIKYNYDAYFAKSELRLEIARAGYVMANEIIYHNGMIKQILK